jgi:glutathionyl-hydroquinone reductase
MPKGKSLPPRFLIQTVRLTWTTVWRAMMAQLAPSNAKGEYQRPESQFRHTLGENSPYPAVAGRYKLIVGQGCPWAQRTLIVRVLKGLEAALPVVMATPNGSGGWILPDPEAGCASVPELYQLAQPGYTGRYTVPVLWDSTSQTIVNNESAEICVILNSSLNSLAQHPDQDLYPTAGQANIDIWNQKIYRTLNNGVYRCGLAQTQTAYTQACQELFETLDQIEQALGQTPYLCGDRLTLADVRLLPTLLRFDLVYYSLFKCNLRRIQDYPHLSRYLRTLYHLPGIAETCDLDTIKQDYYHNLFPLNPGGIVPIGPDWRGYLEHKT